MLHHPRDIPTHCRRQRSRSRVYHQFARLSLDHETSSDPASHWVYLGPICQPPIHRNPRLASRERQTMICPPRAVWTPQILWDRTPALAPWAPRSPNSAQKLSTIKKHSSVLNASRIPLRMPSEMRTLSGV